MANLEQWVSDRLHDILGLSDRYVSQFMIGTARKASSPEDFVARLEQTGTIDIDQSVAAFAKELFEKVHSWNSTRVPCDVHQNSFSFSAGGLKNPLMLFYCCRFLINRSLRNRPERWNGKRSKWRGRTGRTRYWRTATMPMKMLRGRNRKEKRKAKTRNAGTRGSTSDRRKAASRPARRKHLKGNLLIFCFFKILVLFLFFVGVFFITIIYIHIYS